MNRPGNHELATWMVAMTALGADGAAASEWVQLIPAGTFKGIDGRGPYHVGNPTAVIAASMAAAQGKMPVDEKHTPQRAATAGLPSPARGWIVEMQAREDGIWGRVEWTEAGRALRAEGAYRGISPVFEHTASGTVVLIRNAALTNTPNLTQLATLHDQAGHDTTHNQETEMDITELRRALGVDAATDDAGVIAAAVAAVTQRAEHSRAAEMQLTALQTQVSALTSQVAEMTTAEKRARAEGYIDGAIRAGKPILVGRETLIAQHMADPVGTETLVDGMPSINTGGAVLPPTTTAVMDAEDGDPLTSEEMATAKAMGIDPKEKARAKRLKRLGRADEIGKKAVK